MMTWIYWGLAVLVWVVPFPFSIAPLVLGACVAAWISGMATGRFRGRLEGFADGYKAAMAVKGANDAQK